MATINPTCASCKDGWIIVEIPPGSPAKPYQFRLTGPGITPSWSVGGITNYVTGIGIDETTINGGKQKIYKGLGAGEYIVEIDSDDSLSTQTCVESLPVVLRSECVPENDVCKPCGKIIEWGFLSERLSNTHTVKYSNTSFSNPSAKFDPYQIGNSDFTIEFWVDPKNGTLGTSSIFYWLNWNGSQFNRGMIFEDESSSAVFRFVIFNGSNASGIEVDRPPGGYMHHIVLTKTGIDPNDWFIYINGVKVLKTIISGAAINLLTNFPTFSGPITLLDDNVNEINGDISLGTVISPTNLFLKPSNMKFTNFRFYKRIISRREISYNYIAGCHGEPESCNSLILYSPLNQERGGIAQEFQYGNHGNIINIMTSITSEVGGRLWNIQCCKSLLAKPKPCKVLNCDPNWGTMKIRFNHESGTQDPPVDAAFTGPYVFAFIFDNNPCPPQGDLSDLPIVVGAVLNLTGTVTIFGDPESVVPRMTRFAAALADAWNSSLGGLGTATSSGQELTIKFPVSGITGCNVIENFCGRRFRLCVYQGQIDTAQDLNPNYSINWCYPDGEFVVCCNKNIEECEIEQVSINI